MDQNLSAEEKKKNLINKITGILLDEMLKKKVDQELGQEIATYILNQSKNVKDDKSLDDFLRQLAEKYSIFKLYFVNSSLENQIKKTDEEKISSIKDQLSKLANFKSQ
ncbi:hypothetical protein CO165_03770 [Candidatus Roizmanbacteria bacterium CG_4_9_14_3_um_filter_33_18]|uniref:Uncharacterized protein n=2 Tax=Candidatus Roizmaniibacteriota TaxID=1752723 RepID=A0A2M7XXF2_9BACT|nr:MAG: hypothetical protein COW97_03150 [Candidatus Roizmanbacteria bacterium CG22_combo_CG10-13_8_21_14_all_34_12]PJA55407.1 MAG: hypothetical protein CO165_03770 [Candidatus Roizmanbacteria bacterium CG_4_9_14_3_um_filter_33_18]